MLLNSKKDVRMNAQHKAREVSQAPPPQALPGRARMAAVQPSLSKLGSVIDIGNCAQRIRLYADSGLLEGEDLASLAYAEVVEMPQDGEDTGARASVADARVSATILISWDAARIRRAHEAIVDAEERPVLAVLVCASRELEDHLPALGELLDAGMDDALSVVPGSPLREPELQTALLKMDKRALQWENAVLALQADKAKAVAQAQEDSKWGLAGSVFRSIPPMDARLLERGNSIAGVSTTCRLGKGSWGTVYFGQQGSQALALKCVHKKILKSATELCSLGPRKSPSCS